MNLIIKSTSILLLLHKLLSCVSKKLGTLVLSNLLYIICLHTMFYLL